MTTLTEETSMQKPAFPDSGSRNVSLSVTHHSKQLQSSFALVYVFFCLAAESVLFLYYCFAVQLKQGYQEK